MNIETILVTILIFLISALPLHISVNIMGGKTNILKSFLVTFGAGFIAAIIVPIFPFGLWIALIVLIWIYREMFRLKWIKAFIVWILQLIFIFLLTILAGILGIGIISYSLF